MQYELRVGDHKVQLYGDGRLWVEMSIQQGDFSTQIEFPQPYRLSRFAYATYENGRWLLKSPLALASLYIYEAILLRLIQEIDHGSASLDGPLTRQFGLLLANAGLLNTVDDRYRAWPGDDLRYVHTQHDQALQPRTALPPLKPPMSDDVFVLPDIPSSQWRDQSFAEIVTKRRTLYQYTETPITLAQMSEFLARTLKVSGYLEGRYYDSTVRPYPSGGAAYELEAYLFIERCEGIPSGFYHYDPGRHMLERLPLSKTVREFWIQEAIRLTNHQIDHVQTLFFFTARIGRINWKLRPMAVSYTNLGVVFQTLYLTATAMQLAPCAMGVWGANQFADHTGIPLEEEALVGQFLLGNFM